MLEIRDDRQLRSITGVSEKVLEKIEPVFAEVYEKGKEARYQKEKAAGLRKRRRGGGRKSRLDTVRSKVHFILYYLKSYPTIDVLGETFKLSRSNAYENIQKLLPIMMDTLNVLDYLPAHKFEDPKALKLALEKLDTLLVDATEREYFRPKDKALQKEHYSGKQRYHTVKNTVISTAAKQVIYLGKTFSGRNHDYAMFKEEFPPEDAWFEGIKLYADSGYQGMKTDYPKSDAELPFKKPRKSKNNPTPELSEEQKAHNKAVSQTRIFVENAICGIKRFRILVDRFRNRIDGFVDDVIVVCAGLWNAMLA